MLHFLCFYVSTINILTIYGTSVAVTMSSWAVNPGNTGCRQLVTLLFYMLCKIEDAYLKTCVLARLQLVRETIRRERRGLHPIPLQLCCRLSRILICQGYGNQISSFPIPMKNAFLLVYGLECICFEVFSVNSLQFCMAQSSVTNPFHVNLVYSHFKHLKL